MMNTIKTKEILLTTTDDMHGYKVAETIGLIQGSTIVKLNKLDSYLEVSQKGRNIALRRMRSVSEQLHSDAIIGIKFLVNNINKKTFEILAYGTAVKIKKSK